MPASSVGRLRPPAAGYRLGHFRAAEDGRLWRPPAGRRRLRRRRLILQEPNSAERSGPPLVLFRVGGLTRCHCGGTLELWGPCTRSPSTGDLIPQS
jgi:hypothetical protein